MTAKTFASKTMRRTVIAASTLCTVGALSMLSAGCAAVAHSQSATVTANCQGPGAITASACMAPTGSWLYTVQIPGAPAFTGVETYTEAGTYTEADELAIIPG